MHALMWVVEFTVNDNNNFIIIFRVFNISTGTDAVGIADIV